MNDWLDYLRKSMADPASWYENFYWTRDAKEMADTTGEVERENYYFNLNGALLEDMKVVYAEYKAKRDEVTRHIYGISLAATVNRSVLEPLTST